MSISIEAMKKDLLSLDQVSDRLSALEPLEIMPLTSESRVSFEIDPEWALTIDTLSDNDPVDAYVTVDGSEAQLTKEAFGHLSAHVGLPVATVKKSPADAVESFLNRLYKSPAKDMHLLKSGDYASALAPATITQFSTLRLLDNTVEAIQEKYGDDVEIYGDYKIRSTFSGTDVRLIIPAESRKMKNTLMDDVPSGGQDEWAAGIHLSNSLTGKSQTYVDTYLFRWWCTNGCTMENTSVGHWDRRRSDNEPEEVYSWVKSATVGALEDMEEHFDHVQELANLEIHDASSVVGELFSQFNLPARQRTAILDTVSRQSHLTMYSLMQAVTQVANDATLPSKDVERLLRLGGILLADSTLDPQKARIWDAGHFAPSGAPNPFNLRKV